MGWLRPWHVHCAKHPTSSAMISWLDQFHLQLILKVTEKDLQCLVSITFFPLVVQRLSMELNLKPLDNTFSQKLTATSSLQSSPVRAGKWLGEDELQGL